MARYRLDLEYDGGDFLGWQVQSEGRTVQGVLEAALRRICSAEVRIIGAGRTDRGVHATGQVAHFDSRLELPAADFARALAGGLPPDLRLRRCRQVAPTFHARFSAECRRYVYLLSSRETVFRRRFTWVVEQRLDPSAMQVAARAVLGEHDFRPFAVRGGTETTGICRVSRVRWDRWAGGWRFAIVADRFLMRMVRMLVGAMVAVGTGRLAADVMAAALHGGELDPRPVPAPAAGLYLAGVGYPSPVGDHPDR